MLTQEKPAIADDFGCYVRSGKKNFLQNLDWILSWRNAKAVSSLT